MGFKEYEKNVSFLDMELSKILGTSRTQRVLKEIHDHIRWEPLERILVAGYPVGKSPVGNAAYPPLMLLKAVLLQKWFGIRSDPELENQINDRVSFKVFMGLPFGDPSPDHSVISRFRDRVGGTVMERVHAEILGQLSEKGFSIDAGLAVDARLVRSVSTPVSRDKLKQYLGITALNQGAGRGRFTTLGRQRWDRLCHAMAFNIRRSYRAGLRNPVPVPAT